MSLRALVDATFGRRLFVRIWLHGVLLFLGVMATGIPLSPWLREWLRRGTEQSEDHQEPVYRTRERTIKRRMRVAPGRRR